MKEPAAAYIRVSSQEQKLHGLSLAAQEEKLIMFAEVNGLDIVEFYRDEGVSGRKLISKRPELQRMIQDAQAKKFSRIIFIKLDRFFRSVSEYYKCMELLNGIPWTATEEQYDMTTANGRMLINMKLTIAQLEAEQTGERIRMVNEYKVRSGLAIVPTSSMPFCYRREGRQIVKRNEAIMEDLISRYEATLSVRGTMEHINSRYGTQLSYSAVSNTLRNPMICGSYRDNPNYCEPYISKERYDAIQQAINRRTRTTRASDYIFSGLIKCPECGRVMNGTQHTSNRPSGKYKYNVYRCPSHYLDKSCPFCTSVFEKRIEQLMIDRMSKELNNYTLEAEIEQKTEAPDESTLKKLTSELDRINYAWQKGRLSPEDYDRKYDDITAKIAEARAKKERAQKAPKFTSELSGNWLEIYDKLTNAEKSAFWKSTVLKIEINWSPGKDAEKSIREVVFL